MASRLRLLVCAPFTPRLDARHGGKPTAQLLMRLAERHDVAVLCLRRVDEGPVDEAIRARCSRVEEIPFERARCLPHRVEWGIGLLRGLPPWASDCRSAAYRGALERLVDEWRPDLVEIHLQVMAQYVDVPESRAIPRILVDYDPGSAWAAELLAAARGGDRILRRAELVAWRRYERRTRPRFDAIVVFAERDAVAVAPTAGDTRITRIALSIELPEQALDPVGAEPPTVLFVGGFAHHPNRDAATWLGSTLFPRVRQRVPAARLEIVGQEPTPGIEALTGGAVSVHGSVPDVRPYLDRAAVIVAPIRTGGSMRGKVLEALAAGKALVATPRAAEGLDAVPGEHFVLATTEDELVDALVELLVDVERRRTVGHAARAWAERSLGWERGLAEFEKLYAETAAVDR